MMLIPPEKSAAAPQPAIARPTMSIVEFTAVAHIIEPTGVSDQFPVNLWNLEKGKGDSHTFKDQQSTQIDPFDIKIGVYLSETGLQ